MNEPTPTAGSRGRTSALVLVLAHQHHVREQLGQTLRLAGYRVRCAENGTEALNASTLRERPDLAVVEAGLPGLDGLEVARQLRRDEPLLPVVFLTEPGRAYELPTTGGTGQNRLVSKPFPLEELVAQVVAALDGTPGGGQPLRRDQAG